VAVTRETTQVDFVLKGCVHATLMKASPLAALLLVACKSAAVQPEPSAAPSSTAAPAATPSPKAEPSSGPTDASAPVAALVPTPGPGDAEALLQGVGAAESAFAAALYGKAVTGDENLAVSPFSVRATLAMAWAGAHGRTAEEMARVLSLKGAPEQVHSSFAAMLRDLTAPPAGPSERAAPTLRIADRLWGQQGRPFLPAFLDTLSVRYGAPLVPLDFGHAPERARTEINQWVENVTEHKIVDLIAPGLISDSTSLVLTNAIYMKAAWGSPFYTSMTKPGPFHAAGGKEVRVPLMEETGPSFSYAEIDGAKVLDLPYASSGLSMLVVLPKALDGLHALERAMTATSITRWAAAPSPQRVHVVLPRFRITAGLSLAETLEKMGMPSAFDARTADFSGMDGTHQFFISAVVHQAFVAVDEAGTEAAAATAVMMPAGASAHEALPAEFVADHPFLFCIRDRRTGAVLFAGRVVDPS
jgi:serpin B